MDTEVSPNYFFFSTHEILQEEDRLKKIMKDGSKEDSYRAAWRLDRLRGEIRSRGYDE